MRQSTKITVIVAVALVASGVNALALSGKIRVSQKKAYNLQVSGHPAQSLKEEAKKEKNKKEEETSVREEARKCMVKHTDLLGTIGAELAHLAERGINASSLDQVYWPRYLNSALQLPGFESDSFSLDLNAFSLDLNSPDIEDFNFSGLNDRKFFQIHQGRLFAHSKSWYRRNNDGDENNNEFVHSVCSLLRTYPGVPSMRLMSSDEDHTEELDNVPVFVPWKVRGSMPINYPQFRAQDSSQEVKEPPWHQKIPKAFFAGSPSDRDSTFAETRNKRSQLQKLFDRDPVIRDLMSIHVNDTVPHFYTREEQARWKYQLVLDGTAAKTSFAKTLSMQSLVLKPHSPYYEYFEPALVAYKHLVPVNLTDTESSAQDLQATIHWARRHDDIAERIAADGASFAKQHLRESGVQCYFLELLLQYHDLMHFDDALPDEFASSPDLCSGAAR